MKSLFQIHESIQSLNGFLNPFSPAEFLHPTTEKNALIVRELNGEAEILLCLREDLLKTLSSMDLPKDFSLQNLPELSIAIEELSHFNTYCLKASQDQEISQLELEVQGEIDKFGVALEWLSANNEDNFKHQVFESLFGELALGSWVKPEAIERYKEAHLIARQFCRQVLEGKLEGESRRLLFQSFFSSPTADKLSPKF